MTKLTVSLIVQARMGSTRFPGKMMANLDGKSLIEFLLERLKKVTRVDSLILATTDLVRDDVLAEHASSLGVRVYRGSESDVLDRYYHAAKSVSSDIVIRITGDCPLMDPLLIDEMVTYFLAHPCDYLSNVHPPSYPDGFDIELFTFAALEKAWREAKQPSEREHVTPFIWKRKDVFTQKNFPPEPLFDYSSIRLTVDEPIDLEVVRGVLSKLSDGTNFSHVRTLIDRSSDLFDPNSYLKRNEGYKKSLTEDIMDFSKSKKLLAASQEMIPGAAQTYSKSYRYFCEGAAPAFLASGQDGHVFDVDGNEFVDFVLGLGPVTLGYNHSEVNKAITDQLSKGISFTLPVELEITLAKKLISLVPCAEMIKFVKNGSDATTAAVRLARAFTGRDLVLCSGYHGYHDWYIGTTSNHEGVPQVVRDLTKTFTYNDISSLEELFATHSEQVACVILEPCQKQGPTDNFLEKVRALCDQHGALLIFDEVVSGFRMALGGAQEVYGVTPDLSAFGKGVANGASLSFVAGRKDAMQLIERGAFISTTFGGEATALASALKTVEILERPGNMEKILAYGDRFLDSLRDLIVKHGLTDVTRIYGVSPHCGVTFKDSGTISKEQLLTIFQQEHIRLGVLSIGVNNFCLTHTDADVNLLIEAVDAGFLKVREALDRGSVDGMIIGESIRPIFARRGNN